MSRTILNALAVPAFVALWQIATSPMLFAEEIKVLSDQVVTGFQFPESIGCTADGKSMYVSQFGSELKPVEKDGKGKISRLSMDGKVVDDQFLPLPGSTLDKPKGIWVEGDRLWIADIDTAWVVDLKTRKSKKFVVPESQFLNDVLVVGESLYISDTVADRVFKIEPADFLNSESDPKSTTAASRAGMSPNGVYPGKDGSLLVAGFNLNVPDQGALYSVSPKGEVKSLSQKFGQLDSMYQMKDGTILSTDWKTGSLFSWTEKDGMKILASNFKGPADLCAFADDKGLMVIVPDLIKNEVRLIQLAQ
jgi:sugar lactone lactonase YvrE